MESPKTLLIVCCITLAVTSFSDCVTSFALDEDIPSDDYDLLPVTSGKRSVNPFCRRCRLHRDEWMSCSLCYGKPRGIVPYHGKRSSVEDYSDGDYEETLLADDVATKMADKRSFGRSSFLDSRCCDVLGLSECCRRSTGKRGFRTVYFPEDSDEINQPRREVIKREYATSFIPLENSGTGLCSCCNGPLFDFSCCSYSCSKRK